MGTEVRSAVGHALITKHHFFKTSVKQMQVSFEKHSMCFFSEPNCKMHCLTKVTDTQSVCACLSFTLLNGGDEELGYISQRLP